MARGELTDLQWERIQPLLPPEKTGKPGGQWRPHRMVINGILWIARTGAPWRPERYGPFQTCAERLYRWRKDGTWTRLLRAAQAEEDARENVIWEGCALDSTSIKAHPHAAGARRDPLEPEKGGKQASWQVAGRRRRRHYGRLASISRHSDGVGAG